jgi:hypothetical protein
VNKLSLEEKPITVRQQTGRGGLFCAGNWENATGFVPPCGGIHPVAIPFDGLRENKFT